MLLQKTLSIKHILVCKFSEFLLNFCFFKLFYEIKIVYFYFINSDNKFYSNSIQSNFNSGVTYSAFSS